MIREMWPEALIVTPGVRSPNAEQHDQARVDTPYRAIMNGANLIVCGREITQAESPVAEAMKINARSIELSRYAVR